MQLLLLLSAILSALTGAVTGVRAEVPQQVASARISAVVQRVAPADIAQAVRPVQATASLAASAIARPAPAFTLEPMTKPFEGRRRE